MIKFYLSPEAIAVGCTFVPPRIGDAGADISAYIPALDPFWVIHPGQQIPIDTGLHLEIPEGKVGVVKERSGLALDQIHVNAGIVDSTYRGRIIILLENRGAKHKKIYSGAKIAQILFLTHSVYDFTQVESLTDLSATKRGRQGFGSTDDE